MKASRRCEPVDRLRKLQRDRGGRARALPAPCSRSGSSSSNGSPSSSRHRRPTGVGATTSSRPRGTTSSRSACRSASGVPPWPEIPPSTSTPLWRCGRCAICPTETGSRIDASSSASTSPAAQRLQRHKVPIEQGDTEIARTYPGLLTEDLYITAEAEAFVKWHTGQLAASWAKATPQPPRSTPPGAPGSGEPRRCRQRPRLGNPRVTATR